MEFVANAIKEKACPGAQVWFAKDGMVVVNEAFGHHTYESKDTVNKDDLYDLASITKNSRVYGWTYEVKPRLTF